MKLQIPMLILGFLIFMLPIVGLPNFFENIIISFLGLLIMLAIYVPYILTNYHKNTENHDEQKNA